MSGNIASSFPLARAGRSLAWISNRVEISPEARASSAYAFFLQSVVMFGRETGTVELSYPTC